MTAPVGQYERIIYQKKVHTLLGITKLDKEKNQCIREKTGAQIIVKEIKQYQKKVVTTHTEDGHK